MMWVDIVARPFFKIVVQWPFLFLRRRKNSSQLANDAVEGKDKVV